MMILSSAVLCLAANIFHEARSEPTKGQIAVANVTLNRAGSNDRICEVVLERKQFSWTAKYVRYKGGAPVAASLPAKVESEPEAWAKAVQIARRATRGRIRDVTAGATHFHSQAVFPRWAAKFRKTTTIGKHTFYRQSK